MDYDAKIPFNQLVTDWWNSLEKKLTDAATQGKEVVLIALSRKMPRFLCWFKNHFHLFSQNPDSKNILDNVELTTELAIPFIFTERSLEKIEFIILDDIIIHGTSLTSVADELFFLSQRKPRMSCIVRLDKAKSPNNIPLSDFDNIPVVSEEEANKFSDCLSKIVSDNQLPIDMEFPVFKIRKQGLTGNEISNIIEKFLQSEEHKNYISKIYPTGNGRFAIDFKHKANVGLNVDFAKVRFFRKESKVVFEVINPLVFSGDDIRSTSSKIFPHEFYQAIWERTTIKIRVLLREGTVNQNLIPDSVKDNFTRSLAVWVNYLYSVSSLAKNIDNIIPKDLLNYIALSTYDLSLILGKGMSDIAVPMIKTLIVTKDYCVSLKDSVSGALSWFAPDSFYNDILALKRMSAIIKEKAENVYEGIFKFQHYSNPKFSNRYRAFERLFFGETFDSLLEALYPGFDEKDNTIPLRAWIDENIDEGYIVPKYERQRSVSGEITYWRRYFHAGIRKLQ